MGTRNSQCANRSPYQLPSRVCKGKNFRWCWYSIFKERQLTLSILPDWPTDGMERKWFLLDHFHTLRILCQSLHVDQLSSQKSICKAQILYLTGMLIYRHEKRERFFTRKKKPFMIKVFNNTYPISMRCLYQKAQKNESILSFTSFVLITGIQAYNKMEF